MKRAHNFKDRTGEQVGRLRFLSVDGDKTKTKCIWWLCECVCGTVKSIRASSISQGRTLSCGCYMREQQRKPRAAQKRRKSARERGIEEVWFAYKKQARDRQLDWELDKQTFKSFLFAPCLYCGTVGSNQFSRTRVKRTHRYTARLRYNGIDRLDSDRGYTDTNCVTSCSTCNYAKGTRSYDEFVNWLARASAYCFRKAA